MSTNRRQNYRREEDRDLVHFKHEFETARRLSLTLFQNTRVEQVVEKALRAALEEGGAEAGSVLLADPETQQLVFHYSLGEKPVPRGTAIPWDQGISGKVFQTGEPAIISDVKQSRTHYSKVDQSTGFITRDMITLPLKQWEGKPIGVLSVLNKSDGVLNEKDLGILTIISAFTAVAIEQARMFEETKKAEVVYLLGDIGHDLKNLLQPVVSGSELLKCEIDDIFSPEATPSKKQESQLFCHEAIDMVQKTCIRIHDRVREIADCVKGLSAPPEFSSCQVATVVENVLQTLRLLAGEKGIKLQTQNLDSLPLIQADERRLYNAFYNLVNNAIPEVPSGGSITVCGAPLPDTQEILVSVSDTGRGMPEEVRERLFTARAITTKKGGTGLGTKIVKDVVAAHHGKISVDSALGLGTTIHIRLPLDPNKT